MDKSLLTNHALTPNSSIAFAVSGIKHYENDYYKNSPSSFAAFSVTGKKCECRCAHCDAGLLQSMADTDTPEKFISQVDKAAGSGCTGILVSGGSGPGGSVPLLPFVDGISYAKRKGLKVLVHSGLLDLKTAAALKSANVDQVLLDVIGSEKTIRSVYGIDRTPEDFLNSMLYCRNAGLEIAPHIVIGLDYGKIEGEYKAIDLVCRAEAENLVLVVLVPKRGTKMADIPPPPLNEVIDVLYYAVDNSITANIMLGCARPHVYSETLEKAAVDLGFSAIAYPHEKTVKYAKEQGLKVYFFEKCCSLAKFVVRSS